MPKALGAKRHYYLLSVYKNCKTEYTDLQELEEVRMYLHNVINGLKEHSYGIECHGLYKQLHSHSRVSVGETFRYAHLTKYNDVFKIHWQRCDDCNDPIDMYLVDEYVCKSKYNKYVSEAIGQDQWFNNNYGFKGDET